MPSPLKSPTATERGAVPVAKGLPAAATSESDAVAPTTVNVFVTDALIVRGYGSVRVAVYVIDDSSQKQLWFRKPRAKRIKAQPALGFSACGFFSTESPVFGRRVSLKFWPTNSAGCNQMKRSFWTGRRSTNSSKESTRHFEVTVRASICL